MAPFTKNMSFLLFFVHTSLFPYIFLRLFFRFSLNLILPFILLFPIICFIKYKIFSSRMDTQHAQFIPLHTTQVTVHITGTKSIPKVYNYKSIWKRGTMKFPVNNVGQPI